MRKFIDIARAWRDEDYYLSLTEEERASLGVHPSGMAGVNDATLRSVAGGCGLTKWCGEDTPCYTPCGMYACMFCGE